jgi:hypothetical protein
MISKTKMSNLESYQELSIQITCLDMKLNKILELLNKPEAFKDELVIECTPTYGTAQPLSEFVRNKDAFAGSLGSEDEQFLENYK